MPHAPNVRNDGVAAPVFSRTAAQRARSAAREHLQMLAWLTLYAGLVVFCLTVWGLVVLVVWRFGWVGVAVVVVAVVAVWEVCSPFPGPDEPWVLLEDEPGCGLEDAA